MERLAEIDALVSRLFAMRWTGLHVTDAFARADLRFPGVYLLAYSEADLEGARIEARDVFYVGMSNAAGGVRQRLRQFRDGIETNSLHSGARRFYREYCSNRPFAHMSGGKTLWFAALTVACVSTKARAAPDDLRLMGHVACLEHYAIGHVAAETGRKPGLNKFGALPEAIFSEAGTK